MAGIDTIIEWFRGKIPAVLVSSFSTGVVCLIASALVIKTTFTFDWRDVFASAAFLYTLTGVLLFWIITVATYWRSPSLRVFSRIALPLLLVGTCFSLSIAIKQSGYTYNEMGVYQSKHWKLTTDGGRDKTFSSEVIAVQDLSQRPFFVVASVASACPQASIVDFSPTVAGEHVYRFGGEEKGTADPSRSRKWRITSFQPPAKLVLIAKVRNDGSWVDCCLAYNLSWDSPK